MARKKDQRWPGVIAGPIVVFVSMVVLWKNETRYDYYKAAARTTELSDLGTADTDELVSVTGPMDRQLTFSGDDVESFVGYLTVHRRAEIYAWHEDDDDDTGVTWSRRWMGRVEKNSRNRGISQVLSNARFLPAEFRIGDLVVDPGSLQFVDPMTSLDPSQLVLAPSGQSKRLQLKDTYFYLSKGASNQIGDERVDYVGIPVPGEATYFGKFVDNRGQVHDAERRDGWINQLIHDTGILHHLVAGDRAEALASMKGHIVRLKWIVRALGTFAMTGGFILLFSSMVSFLFHIPLVGAIAEWGAFGLGVVFGLPLALLTIAVGYSASHPLLLLTVLAAIFAAVHFTRRRGKKTQLTLKQAMEAEYNRELDRDGLIELEFLELAQLALSDTKLAGKEQHFLRKWGAAHGWSADKIDEMMSRAKEAKDQPGREPTSDRHLENLIKLALSDGNLTPFEMRSIRTVAMASGHDRQSLRQLMLRIRNTAIKQSTTL